MFTTIGVLLAIFAILALLEQWRWLTSYRRDSRGRLQERRLWWHSQNLNEKPGGRLGAKWRHGRAWLHVGSNGCLHAEWHFFSIGSFSIGFDVGGDGDNDFLIYFCPCFFSIYLGVEGLKYGLGWKWLPDYGRECSLRVHHWAVWINPWSREHEWRSEDPWWIRGLVIHLDDLIFGRDKYSEHDLETRAVLVPMPEGSYKATARLFESTWARPRWFARRLLRVELDIKGGIPHEGKGENSWDCGEDATFGTTCPAETIEEGIAKLVESVLESRHRRGGSHIHRDLVPVTAPPRI